MSMRTIVDSRKNSSTNFQLETGISVDSGSGGSSSKQGMPTMRKNVKNALIFSGDSGPDETMINSQEFVEEAFKMFREMLGNTTPLKNMGDKVFGAGFKLSESLSSGTCLSTISKILRASINSFLILDRYTQHR